MLGLYLFCIALILYMEGVQGEQDIMPEQTFSSCDENRHQITRENDALKATIEDLKIRLELQSHELKLMKMEGLINESKNLTSPQVLLEMQKILVEPILMKLDTLVNVIKTQENISLSRNNELLNALNLYNSNSHTMNNHTMEETSMEDKSNKENLIHGFSNCSEALMKIHHNGIYNITLRNYRIPFPVYCDGGWTVIQRRQDGAVDFYRNWTEYQNGFGVLDGDFFIGLDKLHALTTESSQELLIELESFENEIRYAKYDSFAIRGEDEYYAIDVVGSYSGDAGDSLTSHKNRKFSTKDRDNDNWSSGNCAIRSMGAWWFNNCQASHLNGVYSKSSKVGYEQGVNWSTWKGDYYSLKRARMLIRPKHV